MADQERLVNTLIDLIQIDSPSGEEDDIDVEISSRLKLLGLTVSHDSYNNVIARLAGRGVPLLLSAHLDTVEPGRGIKPIVDDTVMRSDGSGERLLTENFYQEAPSWSPNGRVLIFYRETKTDSEGRGFSAKLWSIDLTGYNERLIETETYGSDPSWSSLLSK